MLDFTLENISAEYVERLRAVYEPLTRSVRELIDATIRTEVDANTVAVATAEIDSATARLRSKQLEGTFGIATSPAVSGWRGATSPLGFATLSPRRWWSITARWAKCGATFT